ncbi:MULTISPECIES: hypothetical protein [unclassified Novosphingobium]|uniref:hypothetical protein n=1 Tax=unclassified Novosphingobium TaxID=2644732 RepID=UPI0010BDFD1A|nr:MULTISPECIES: hypothetical protein [unclassified Novosphingobium]QCI96356.1 hypothetical protein FA702_22140 [Novosphingobium sp. EMRT-2]
MMKQFDVEPVVAKWELHSVATMLIATYGEDAERTAEENLAIAIAEEHEGNETVWTGIITQLREIRKGDRHGQA